MTITYQRQPTKNSCGQTVVAMLTGLPVESIIELYGHSKATYRKNHERVLEALGYKLGEDKDFTCLEDLPPVAMVRIGYLKKSGAACRRESRRPRRMGHAVLWAEGKFWCPLNGVFSDALPFQTKGRIITHVRAISKETNNG